MDKKPQTPLSPEEYRVLYKKGTEPPFSGKYLDHEEEGVYACRMCDAPLFLSENKYHSGCGWPSFDRPLHKKCVTFCMDDSHGMRRTEVICTVCHSHLGHMFPDGPTETGKRYCINSVSLVFHPS